MIYFRAKKDARFIKSFREAVFGLWNAEEAARKSLGPRSLVDEDEKVRNDIIYQKMRELIARDMSRAVSIARRLQVPADLTFYPAPAIGGPVIELHAFEAILHDPTHRGLDRQVIVDDLNRTIGAAEERVSVEFRRLINPLYWLKEGLKLVLRIPFMLIEATGFNVAKIEDHLWGRLFKVAEILLLVYLAARFGLDLDLLK